MAKASQTRRTITVRSTSSRNGMMKCNICGGTGYHKIPKKKKSSSRKK